MFKYIKIAILGSLVMQLMLITAAITSPRTTVNLELFGWTPNPELSKTLTALAFGSGIGFSIAQIFKVVEEDFFADKED